MPVPFSEARERSPSTVTNQRRVVAVRGEEWRIESARPSRRRRPRTWRAVLSAMPDTAANSR